MPTKRTRQPKAYFTTGDIARRVGCDDLTVRRWLKEHGYHHKSGEHYRFDGEQFADICDRMEVAHIRYPNHIGRFEKVFGALNKKIPLAD